jgi:hypothetical protein
MSARAIQVTARVCFIVCGLVSLFTGVPYVMLRGIGLPVQSEWSVFVIALALAGVLSLAVGVLPRSWLARAYKRDREELRLLWAPLKVLCGFAAVAYLVAIFAFFAPHRWNLNPQLMLALCPMYFVKMTIDPSPLSVYCVLAPMNAAVFGSVGVVAGYLLLGLRGPRARRVASDRTTVDSDV